MGAESTHDNAAVSCNQTTRKPDFFIIGAPKAGTTSLYTYLVAHPQIFMSRVKEPMFFCSDFPALREKASLIDDTTKYLKLFARATDRHRVCGEASSLYLFSKVAIPELLEFNPNARIIVMLRNPVDLVHSFHSQLVFGLHESVTDFEQAWRLQEARAQGQSIPKDCLERAVLQYQQVGMLGNQMSRLLAHVCRSHVKVLLFDDLITHPRRLYEDVLSFLNVPSDHRSQFPKENANKARRSQLLTRMLRNPPFPLNVLRHRYLQYVGADTWPVRAVARLNRKPMERSQLSKKLRCELADIFHDDIRLLEGLIGRDLSDWVPARRRPVCELTRRAG